MTWKKVKIGSFLFERKERYKPEEANTKGLKRIEKIDFSGKYYLVNKKTNTDMIIVKTGDLLISGINAEKGAVTIYQDEDNALATIHYSSYEFDNKKIYIDYFRWFLKTDIFKNLLKISAGSGIKTELKSKHLLPLEIELPELTEQKEIVKVLGNRIQQINLLEKEVEQQKSYLQLLRQTILHEAVQGKLTKQNANDEPASELLKRIKAEKHKLINEGKLKKEKEIPPINNAEIPFELPNGWEWCRLGNIVDLKSGVTLGKTYKGDLIEVPYLRVANVQRGFIDLANLKMLRVPFLELEKYRLEKGDLCMIEGGDWDKVGRCAIWKYDINPCIHQNHIFRLRFYGNILPEWAEAYLNSPIARRYFESYSKQTTNLASINKTQLTNLLFPLPQLEEQRRLINKIHKSHEYLKNIETLNQKHKNLLDLILQTVLKENFMVNNYDFNGKKAIGLVTDKLSTDYI